MNHLALMEYSLSYLVILALTGLVAGVINTLAGGGSNLTLPALMITGMPADIANATNRVGVFLQCLVGVRGFKKLLSLSFVANGRSPQLPQRRGASHRRRPSPSLRPPRALPGSIRAECAWLSERTSNGPVLLHRCCLRFYSTPIQIELDLMAAAAFIPYSSKVSLFRI